MKPYHTLKAILLAVGIAGSANAAIIDVVTDDTLTELDATLGVRVLKQDQTWTKNNQYILNDRLFIKSGQTLTIEPGTKIYGSTDDNDTPGSKTDDKVGSIIAARGGRLVADGTANEPIIFTAIQVLEVENNTDYNGDSVIGPMPTSANGGLWGGIVLLGNAYVSQSDSTGANIGKAEIEGFLPAGTPDVNPVDGLADAITYGFDSVFPRDDEDDSGIIRYVSIRHGGYEFAAGKEINGLTMGGVGSGTTIEYVEVYANTDDGFEWFGGTGSTKYLVSAFNQDDSFDFDSGHTGTHQFLFAIQDPGVADGGGELDGIESTPSSGPNQLAGKNSGLTLSKPIFYNMTLIGPGSTNTKSTIGVGTGQVLTEKGNHGMIIEDYFNGEFYNSVFHDFTQHLVSFRDNANSTGATAAAAHNTIGAFGNGTPGSNATYISGTNSFNLFYDAFGLPQNGNSNANTDIGLREYTRNTIAGTGPGTGTFLASIDPRPAFDSPLWGASLQSGAPEEVSYRGAFGTENWTAGWTLFDQVYGVEGVSGDDTAPPTITLIGNNPINLTVGDLFTDPGANVTDNIDAPRTITGTGTVNTAVAATYTLTYDATDEAGNVATTVTRNVIVSEPKIALPTSDDFRASVGAPLNIANYFQNAPFDTATSITVVGALPKGMTFNTGTRVITGYPAGSATARFLVTLPGEDPVQFVMNFSQEPIPASLLGSHVLHTDDRDAITVIISSKGTTVSILKPGQKAVALKGVVLRYNDGADPGEEWTIEVPSSQLSIAFPVARTFKAGDNSYLGNYGTFEGDALWGFKGSLGLGSIVLSKDSITVTITGVIGAKGVAWSVTPAGGKAIKSTGSISPDGIASINTIVPGVGALMGMLRVDEELDDNSVPTGELNVSLLQGFDGWSPISYTP